LLTKDSVFNWTEEHDCALENLKQALLTEVVLIYPDFDEPFTIITDASSEQSAHILCHMKDKVLRSVAFGGRAYTVAESKMCSTDLELLSILNALDNYRQYISNDKRLTIMTDNYSLKFIQNLKFLFKPKLVKYPLNLQNFEFDVVQLKGKDNFVTDFLSRYPIHIDHEASDNKPEPNSFKMSIILIFFVVWILFRLLQTLQFIPETPSKNAGAITKCRSYHWMYKHQLN
jgi:hypothetical protein